MATPVAGVPGLFISYECITEELEQRLIAAARKDARPVGLSLGSGRSFMQWHDGALFPDYVTKAWSGCVYGGGGMPDVVPRHLPSQCILNS
jgi:hypothetical protein